MNRVSKFEAIYAYAKSLAANGKTVTFYDLGIWLNQRGFTTGYGTAYCLGGRGVARVVHAAYAYVKTELGLGDAGASPIAKAFTARDGGFAYD